MRNKGLCFTPGPCFSLEEDGQSVATNRGSTIRQEVGPRWRSYSNDIFKYRKMSIIGHKTNSLFRPSREVRLQVHCMSWFRNSTLRFSNSIYAYSPHRVLSNAHAFSNSASLIFFSLYASNIRMRKYCSSWYWVFSALFAYMFMPITGAKLKIGVSRLTIIIITLR